MNAPNSVATSRIYRLTRWVDTGIFEIPRMLFESLQAHQDPILNSVVSFTLALGAVCGIAVVRSSARLPIRILGVLVTLGEFFYAFFFLFAATIGLR
jgi:presenilin-like A22 family membrane protease